MESTLLHVSKMRPQVLFSMCYSFRDDKLGWNSSAQVTWQYENIDYVDRELSGLKYQ